MATPVGEPPDYLGHRRRLKERFKQGGLKALSADYELVELILGYAIPRKDLKTLAKRLLKTFGSFQGILNAPLERLEAISGVGEHTALLFKVILASLETHLGEKIRRKPIISSPQALMEYLKVTMSGLRDETVRVLFLNTQNELIVEEVLQEGTVDQTVVYPRKVLERALYHKATALIVVHNHPSGNPAPSPEDEHLTRALKEAARNLNIQIHDHLIMGRGAYFSFRESGRL
jgi:DNA repair protein RadC